QVWIDFFQRLTDMVDHPSRIGGSPNVDAFNSAHELRKSDVSHGWCGLTNVVHPGIGYHADRLERAVRGRVTKTLADGIDARQKTLDECLINNHNLGRLGIIGGIETPPAQQRDTDGIEIVKTDVGHLCQYSTGITGQIDVTRGMATAGKATT